MSEGCCPCGKNGGGACSAEGASTKSKGIKNGKGSAPRNISKKFRSNYEGIRWSLRDSVKTAPGEKFVKVYA